MTAEQTAAYLASCAANRTKTDYFSSRGISEATAARFSLGYDGALSCVVLPCDDGHIVRRSTAEKNTSTKRACRPRCFKAAFCAETSPFSSSRAYLTRSAQKNSASVPVR